MKDEIKGALQFSNETFLLRQMTVFKHVYTLLAFFHVFCNVIVSLI